MALSDQTFPVVSPSIIVDPETGRAVRQNEQLIDIAIVQNIAIGVASVQSAAVGEDTQRVVLVATKDCWVAIGANPTAAAHDGAFFMAAGSQSYPIKVTPSVTKIAVIQDSAAGYLSVIESA